MVIFPGSEDLRRRGRAFDGEGPTGLPRRREIDHRRGDGKAATNIGGFGMGFHSDFIVVIVIS